MSEAPQVHPTAVVDPGAVLERGVAVWHFCHVMEGAVLGEGCSLGQNVFVARGVRIGAGTKIQNNVSVYEGVALGRNCFVGPSVVFTNVKAPRAEVPRRSEYVPTEIEDGVTLGANATIVCGVRIGRYAVVGAGAVVTRDVAAHRVVTGVPARPTGWACACGAVLVPRRTDAPDGTPGDGTPGGGDFVCPSCARGYRRSGTGDRLEEREG